jgi:hypothetical protein
MELTTPHSKNKLVTKVLKKPRTWTDSLDKRPKRRKMDMGFGTWKGRFAQGCGGCSFKI